ncbi:methyltransferase domain-containing protein [Cardiobacteriaceae bacterium TAE3-ERU3]|nr:methyltransferase domain-containing protein [Cardiobacteriaceae bacterium TAE3-ERU3]
MPPFNTSSFTSGDYARPEGQMGLKLAVLMHQSNASMTYKSANTLNLQEDDLILEVGQGGGDHIAELHRRHPGIRYTGIDHSHTLHAHCAENETLKALDCKFVEGKARQHTLPFADNTFDALLAVNLIYFFDDLAAITDEYARVLKPGGRIAIAFKDKATLQSAPIELNGLNLYQPQELQAAMESSGFDDIAVTSHSEDVLRFDGSWAERTYHIVTAICAA